MTKRDAADRQPDRAELEMLMSADMRASRRNPTASAVISRAKTTSAAATSTPYCTSWSPKRQEHR